MCIIILVMAIWALILLGVITYLKSGQVSTSKFIFAGCVLILLGLFTGVAVYEYFSVAPSSPNEYIVLAVNVILISSSAVGANFISEAVIADSNLKNSKS